MPPPPRPTHQAAKPTREIFDPWNSSATGHQRAENRLSGNTSWRESRSYKLGHQFLDSNGGGGDRLSDLVGAGSENFGVDGRKDNGDWEDGAPGLRERGWQDIRCLLDGSKKPGPSSSITSKKPNHSSTNSIAQEPDRKPGIFATLTIYINGSTAPLVSDHKLKQLVSQHGANVSIALARRSVTHVILGVPNRRDGKGAGAGAGGGLAARKIQKEIETVRGKGVKFVGVEWILESIKAGKRLPEARFTPLHLAPRAQKSVYGLFRRQGSGDSLASSSVSETKTEVGDVEGDDSGAVALETGSTERSSRI